MPLLPIVVSLLLQLLKVSLQYISFCQTLASAFFIQTNTSKLYSLYYCIFQKLEEPKLLTSVYATNSNDWKDKPYYHLPPKKCDAFKPPARTRVPHSLKTSNGVTKKSVRNPSDKLNSQPSPRPPSYSPQQPRRKKLSRCKYTSPIGWQCNQHISSILSETKQHV